MNTEMTAVRLVNTRPGRYVPRTERGKTLFTIDWFLNGKPTPGKHDSQQLKVRDICKEMHDV